MANTPLLKRIQMRATTETTNGTLIDSVATDIFEAYDMGFSLDPDFTGRDRQGESLGRKSSIIGNRKATMSFAVEMAGSGTAGSAPFWGKLIKACQFAEVIVGGTSVVYRPASSGTVTLTMAEYVDNVNSRIIIGAAGNIRIGLKKGERPMMFFTFTGKYQSHGANTFSATSNYPTAAKPIPFLGSTTYIGSYQTPFVSELEIDMGNVITGIEDASDSVGFAYFKVTDRNPTGRVNLAYVPTTSYDAFAEMISNTEATILQAITTTLNGGAGNIVNLSIGRARWTKLDDTFTDRAFRTNQSFELVESANLNDEIVITLT